MHKYAEDTEICLEGPLFISKRCHTLPVLYTLDDTYITELAKAAANAFISAHTGQLRPHINTKHSCTVQNTRQCVGGCVVESNKAKNIWAAHYDEKNVDIGIQLQQVGTVK